MKRSAPGNTTQSHSARQAARWNTRDDLERDLVLGAQQAGNTWLRALNRVRCAAYAHPWDRQAALIILAYNADLAWNTAAQVVSLLDPELAPGAQFAEARLLAPEWLSDWPQGPEERLMAAGLASRVDAELGTVDLEDKAILVSMSPAWARSPLGSCELTDSQAARLEAICPDPARRDALEAQWRARRTGDEWFQNACAQVARVLLEAPGELQRFTYGDGGSNEVAVARRDQVTARTLN